MLHRQQRSETAAVFEVEGLEGRCLLSASHASAVAVAHAHSGSAVNAPVSHGKGHAKGHGKGQSHHQMVLFSAAPQAVQTGLQAQAPTGVTICADKKVQVITNKHGTFYTTDVTVNGQEVELKVDANGNPIPDDSGGGTSDTSGTTG